MTDLYFHEKIQKFTHEHLQESQPWVYIATDTWQHVDKFCTVFNSEVANKGIRVSAGTVGEMWAKFVQNGYKTKKEL